jgi:hypothetical protein
MNIGHVGNNGGIDRGADRPVRTDGKADQAPSATTDDRAAISSDGRDAKAAFDARVAAAGSDDPARRGKVARAIERLASGQLDTPAVYRDVAGRLLAGDFRSV